MKLKEAIKQTPLLRPNAFPNSCNMVIVCQAAALSHIPTFFLEKIKAVFVINHDPSLPKEMPENKDIKVFPLENLGDQVSFDIVHFHHIYEYGPLASCAAYLRRVGFESFYNFMPIPYNLGITTFHIPNYLLNNQQDLEQFYDLLEDEESKITFASRIRAIETGNVGYIRVSKFSEYFHPVVKPMEGDVIIDGGVSESVHAQIQFSKTVREHGKIYGFEPDPIGLCKATEKLKEYCPHDNYTLIPLGLWSKKDTLYFEINGQGTHVSETRTDRSTRCDVISIDEFRKANNIQKIDLIKLDVEGAEKNAIKGAIQSITLFKPKLAISLYHTHDDLYYLPKLIHNICPDYKFYLGHHHASLHETILYAAPR
jgi:FkbM family methyltransferase